MSGGSYNYLCHKDVSDLSNSQEDIQQMVDRLAGLGYAEDAARESEELLLTIRQYQTRINAMRSRLMWVWRSVEWWDSGNTSEEGVIQALSEYRGAIK